MRYVIACVVAAALIAALILFSFGMARQARTWEEQNATLTGAQVVLLRAASAIRAYWWLIFPGILLAALGLAGFLPGWPNA